MTDDDYKRVCKSIKIALRRWNLSFHDLQDVQQEAALAAWQNGPKSTEVRKAGRNAADRLQGRGRALRPVFQDSLEISAGDHVENETIDRLMTTTLLDTLSASERYVIEQTVLHGRTQLDVGLELGVMDSTICRWRRSALDKMRETI